VAYSDRHATANRDIYAAANPHRYAGTDGNHYADALAHSDGGTAGAHIGGDRDHDPRQHPVPNTVPNSDVDAKPFGDYYPGSHTDEYGNLQTARTPTPKSE
jgi:hypothetical protein